MTDSEQAAWDDGYRAGGKQEERIPPYTHVQSNLRRYWYDGYAAAVEEQQSKDASHD